LPFTNNLAFVTHRSKNYITMPATIRQYKAAAVQAEPGWFNLEKSVKKTVDLIREAGEKGCKLIGFPELCKCPQRPRGQTERLQE
jgi:predicted amidohydrolase